MELDENLRKDQDVSKTWEQHINEKIGENLKKAIKNRDIDNLEEIKIDDMAAIDSIEDGIVRCEILNGSMVDIPYGNFKYEIEEGDVINLKLTYKEGALKRVEVLDKNNEEKELRLKMIQEKIRKMHNKE